MPLTSASLCRLTFHHSSHSHDPQILQHIVFPFETVSDILKAQLQESQSWKVPTTAKLGGTETYNSLCMRWELWEIEFSSKTLFSFTSRSGQRMWRMGEVSKQPTKANICTSVWNVAELSSLLRSGISSQAWIVCSTLWWVQGSELYPTYARQRDWPTKRSMPQSRRGR